jgi:sulfate adenylyltransferase subunit 2
LVRLAQKHFPAKIPFPLLHVDTGHNSLKQLNLETGNLGGLELIRNVQDAIDEGKVVEETGKYSSRNSLQQLTLMQLKNLSLYWWCRRDEEKRELKNVFFLRDDFGQWDEKNQRPECLIY